MSETTTPAPAKAAPPVAKDPNEGLIKVRKDDVVLFVHPTALADHVAVGWARF